MYQTEKKQAVEAKNVVTEIGVYTVYDTVTKQFDLPVCVPVAHLNDYFTMLVNDVNSRYYGHESDYILNKIGVFDRDTGEIIQKFIERISVLDSYIDNNKRNLQTIIQTLNYLPTGYYKMPAEQKEVIQDNINTAISKYVENYVVPDLDINSEKDKLYREKCINFVKNLRQFTEESHWKIPEYTCEVLDGVIDDFFESFEQSFSNKSVGN